MVFAHDDKQCYAGVQAKHKQKLIRTTVKREPGLCLGYGGGPLEGYTKRVYHLTNVLLTRG